MKEILQRRMTTSAAEFRLVVRSDKLPGFNAVAGALGGKVSDNDAHRKAWQHWVVNKPTALPQPESLPDDLYAAGDAVQHWPEQAPQIYTVLEVDDGAPQTRCVMTHRFICCLPVASCARTRCCGGVWFGIVQNRRAAHSLV